MASIITDSFPGFVSSASVLISDWRGAWLYELIFKDADDYIKEEGGVPTGPRAQVVRSVGGTGLPSGVKIAGGLVQLDHDTDTLSGFIVDLTKGLGGAVYTFSGVAYDSEDLIVWDNEGGIPDYDPNAKKGDPGYERGLYTRDLHGRFGLSDADITAILHIAYRPQLLINIDYKAKARGDRVLRWRVDSWFPQPHQDNTPEIFKNANIQVYRLRRKHRGGRSVDRSIQREQMKYVRPQQTNGQTISRYAEMAAWNFHMSSQDLNYGEPYNCWHTINLSDWGFVSGTQMTEDKHIFLPGSYVKIRGTQLWAYLDNEKAQKKYEGRGHITLPMKMKLAIRDIDTEKILCEAPFQILAKLNYDEGGFNTVDYEFAPSKQ